MSDVVAGGLIKRGLRSAGNSVLIQERSGPTRTGDDILADVDALASALIERGYAGRTIGLWYRNSAAAIEAFLAVEWIGGTRLAVDPNAAPAEVEAVFAAAGVAVVLTDAAGAAHLGGNVLIHDRERLLRGASTCPEIEVDGARTLILYPRAVQADGLFSVPISYANWDATLETSIALFRSGAYGSWQEQEERFLSCQQIMHGTGFLGTFPFLAMGLPQVVVREFEVNEVIDAIEAHAITSTMLVPVMLNRLAAATELAPSRTKSLRHVLYGGGKVELDDLRRAISALGPVLSQLYGRFEGGWPICVLSPEDHRAIGAGRDDLGGSCGRVIEGIEAKLRSLADANPSCGEICVRGARVVQDYADADGWCSLGDIMEINGDGYLAFRGRLDRMINTGYHIYPAEVEAVIMAVPRIVEAHVVGEAHREWGQTVVAYLVLEDGSEPRMCWRC